MPPPDRWDEYRAMGSVIPGTKFIAFKVPLKKELCSNLSENERFSPAKLIEDLTASGKSLGLVIDLTFTHKYYNGLEFTQHSIQHKKILTKGHEVPSEDVYSEFGEVVDNFCEQHKDRADILIGVHCTHGVNRTGYLVCRYMIEKLKIPPYEAITLFNEARGHPLERENYIQDLKTRPRPSHAVRPGDSHGSEAQDWHQRPKDHRQDRSYHDRSRRTWGQNRHQEYSIPADRHGSQHRRLDVHSSREFSGGEAKRQRSADSHVSPLARLEGPPEPTWGSGASAGWGRESSWGWDRGASVGWRSGAREGRGRGADGRSRGRSYNNSGLPSRQSYAHPHQFDRGSDRHGDFQRNSHSSSSDSHSWRRENADRSQSGDEHNKKGQFNNRTRGQHSGSFHSERINDGWSVPREGKSTSRLEGRHQISHWSKSS